MASNILPPLTQLDPAEVWRPWQPDDKHPWNQKWAAHLFRRAAFGAPPYTKGIGYRQGMEAAVQQGLDKSLALVLEGGPGQKEFDQLMDDLGPYLAPRGRYAPGQNATTSQGWWVYRMIYSPHPLRERMTLFWHNHFATSIDKVNKAELMLRQNQLFRQHALASFRRLVLAVSRDPAMLVWLDGNSNVKGKPNENFARELLELFTLGVANYTETDIRQAARAFTGWHIASDQFRFRPDQHDDGGKTIFGQTGKWDGADIIRIVLEQPAAARFLVRKLYQYLISEGERPPEPLIEHLAAELRRSDYDIRQTVETMLRSRLFFSQHAYRQRVKSPAEYVIGLVRVVDSQSAPEMLVVGMNEMGQRLLAPPNVKGWDGGKAWLNSATLLARQNFAMQVLDGRSSPRPVINRGQPERHSGSDPIRAIGLETHADPDRIVKALLELLLQGQVNPSAIPKLVAFLKEGNPKESEWEKRLLETAHTITLMPEFQLA
jgi:hypothetical protein